MINVLKESSKDSCKCTSMITSDASSPTYKEIIFSTQKAENKIFKMIKRIKIAIKYYKKKN